VIRPCPNCGREFGQTAVCQSCGQVSGLPLGIRTATPGRRLGAALLDGLLVIVTAVIGWLIWAFIVSKNGQGPAKSILGMRVVKLPTGQVLTRGQMFVRWLVKRLLGLIFIAWVIAALWLLWDKDRQALWDKIVETVVVDDPGGVLLQPGPQAAAPGQSQQQPQPQGSPTVPPPPPQP
jgi:uncharacterized RDD family membrane protein YckC